MGALKMRVAGRRRLDVRIGLLGQGLLQIGNCQRQRSRLRTQIESKVGGNLIVATPTSAQLSAHFPKAIYESAFDCCVDVFVLRSRFYSSGGDVGTQFCDGRHHLGELVISQQPSAIQDSGMGLSLQQVVVARRQSKCTERESAASSGDRARREPATHSALFAPSSAIALIPLGRKLRRQSPEVDESLGQ